MAAGAALPYGTWPSPISSELVVRAAAGLSDVRVDPSTGAVWWSESRPDEGGRITVVRQDPATGVAQERVPATHSARTRVHEYGGAAWWVADDTLWFANWDDQRIWRRGPGDDAPVPVTPEPAQRHGERFADGVVSSDGGWIVCVRESHVAADGTALDEARNEIVAVPARADGGGEPVVLVAGTDFVSSPRLDPTGTRLAWLVWDHPRMPWDGTELWTAALVLDGPLPHVVEPSFLAGGPDEALVQPEWTEDGHLLVVSDRSEWWNVHRVDGTGDLEPLGPVDAEVATPPWVFGQSRYVVDPARGRIIAALTRAGTDALAVVEQGRVREVPTSFTAWSALRLDGDGRVVGVAAAPDAEPAVVRVDLADAGSPGIEVLRPSRDLGLAPEWFSRPEPIEFPTSGGRTAHALLYRPTNPEVTASTEERPPLIVTIHGGPTSAARPQLSLATQFWTSRGFAVVDVNYGGSTGYGRSYRRQLDGAWGIVDVDDCEAAARFLAERGDVDGDRLLIRGGSAGGFTTLAALAFRDTFAAGASSYGVADLAALAADTHKFESRYLDGLVGPYPESSDVYAERSPIHHLDGFDRPLIVFQGLEDEIVPPNQSEAIVAALEERGVPVAYVAFEGEQHGFRRAENIRRVLEAELWFYGHVLGFEPADRIDPVELRGA
ncbi:S9 family peptidase [Actinomarinicola tropica]|uniref:Prolyl oligopeptidase family serine peptidase n=1 Tax=Actinomarinicola tropica TaxID=2789776 RepID=A0A5Q2RJW3_9ACTN|nr:prolyl oligopeptidase family serine peptidase [Actinomarinicola tropica]QGG94686.1 prolyl oligopeptidase family serine peptidase [Actinomarinicola tropica]